MESGDAEAGSIVEKDDCRMKKNQAEFCDACRLQVKEVLKKKDLELCPQAP